MKCGEFRNDNGNINVKSQQKEFSASALERVGAFSGSTQYPFGCWAPIGKDDQTRNTFMYGYTVTAPSGEKFDQGPFGIWAGGSGAGSIIIPSFKSRYGQWSVEYFTIRRDNGDRSSLGKSTFVMKE